MERGSSQPVPEVSLTASSPRQEDDRVQFIPTEEEGIFIRSVGFSGELPTELHDKALDARSKLTRLLAPIRRSRKIVQSLEDLHLRYPWFRGVHNENNRTYISVFESSTRIVDQEGFREALGSLYPMAVKGESITITIKTEANGIVLGKEPNTGKPKVVDVFDLVNKIPEALQKKGVDEIEARKRVSITKNPVVDWDFVHEAEENGEVVFPEGVIATSVTVKPDEKATRPLDQKRIKKLPN